MSTGETASGQGAEAKVQVHHPTPEEKTRAAFGLYEAELAPGAIDILSKGSAQRLGHMSAEARAEAVAEIIAGPLGDKWRNPEYRPPTLEGDVPASPLRLALMMYGDKLRPGAVEALMTELGAKAAGKSPAKVAGIVARLVESKEGGRYHASHYDPAPSFRPAPKAEPARSADGRFSEPPAGKPPGRPKSSF